MTHKVYYTIKDSAVSPTNRWSALDPNACHPSDVDADDDDDVVQESNQVNKTLQISEEYIFIKDSCDVTISTTDTKAAVSLQGALQAAIALVINISIADGETAERVTQDLLQAAKTKQKTFQKTVVENSRNVDVTTTDTQVSVNIQILLQLLLALIVKLEIL
ncbi:spore coat protein [Salipaludibacillus neizhouensis]|uniref:Spore coat protein n=1 Tax=Salipaludibacillus neizhouensis TaxID=885475 RepID=A0A3A9K7J9_9BACI|nr:spore coat protein [Salipaludibacillus neizhouensis]RKL66331.1 spore coat protein [Salipaludibacillus neizhouensis]